MHYLPCSSKTDKLGIGDLEIGYSTMPLLDSTAFSSALGFNLLVQVPTGNYINNLGIGAMRITPGVIANLKLSDRMSILPELKYIFTSKILQDVPEMAVNKSMHGYDASLKLVFKPTSKSWFWLTPALTTFDFENSSSEFELEILYGVVLLNRIGLSAYFNRNFTTNAYNFQFINAIYF
jgi:hypothetical protein